MILKRINGEIKARVCATLNIFNEKDREAISVPFPSFVSEKEKKEKKRAR